MLCRRRFRLNERDYRPGNATLDRSWEVERRFTKDWHGPQNRQGEAFAEEDSIVLDAELDRAEK